MDMMEETVQVRGYIACVIHYSHRDFGSGLGLRRQSNVMGQVEGCSRAIRLRIAVIAELDEVNS